MKSREIYEAVRNAFQLPPGWDSGAWRHDVILASGLTALAAEATLLDAVGSTSCVLRDPMVLKNYLRQKRKGIIGCSFSCRTAEVLDGLALARAHGLETCLVGARLTREPDVPLPCIEMPLPLRHVAFCAVLPHLLGRRSSVNSVPPNARLFRFLKAVLLADLVPLFASSGRGFHVSCLVAYWLEFLRRPAFQIEFPRWTHDLLWTVASRCRENFAYILEAPVSDLSDGRFRQVVNLMDRTKAKYLVLENTEAGCAGGHVGNLLMYADGYYDIACEVGLDLCTELRFGPSEETDP